MCDESHVDCIKESAVLKGGNRSMIARGQAIVSLNVLMFCNKWGGRGMWRVWGRGELCTVFWWGNLREREHWGDLDVDGRIVLRWIFGEW